jgi:hypothetical protein
VSPRIRWKEIERTEGTKIFGIPIETASRAMVSLDGKAGLIVPLLRSAPTR